MYHSFHTSFACVEQVTECPNLVESPKNVAMAPLSTPLAAGELYFTTIDLSIPAAAASSRDQSLYFRHRSSPKRSIQHAGQENAIMGKFPTSRYVFVNPRGPPVQVGSGSVVSYAHLVVDQASGREGRREKRAITIGSRSLAGYRSYLGAGASIGNGSMVGKIRYCDAK